MTDAIYQRPADYDLEHEVDVTMPKLRVFADSLQAPPRALLEVDRDSTDPETGRRLVAIGRRPSTRSRSAR
jgi:hypothetical protein